MHLMVSRMWEDSGKDMEQMWKTYGIDIEKKMEDI